MELLEENKDSGEVFVGAMLYLIPDGISSSISADQLTSTFNLTPAEAEVCSLLMQNTPAKTIAKLENKSEATVREQIQSSYVKCGVSNQLELINLIGSLPVHN
jgi:DNA-binding CsgD family transcriptional regulator